MSKLVFMILATEEEQRTRTVLLALVFPAATLASGQSLPGNSAARAKSDNSAGRKIFKQCRNCYSMWYVKFGTFGLNLYQVVGRMVGTAPKYNYSPSLAGAGLAWTAEPLDHWLTNPQVFLQSPKMKFFLESAAVCADLIANLSTASNR